MPDQIIVNAPGPQGPAGTGGGGGVTDGDKGDITVSNSGSVWNIDAGVVSTTELGGDITAAGKALLDDADAAAQRTTLGLGTAATRPSTNFATSNHTHTASDITSQPARSLVARPDATGGACTAVTLGTGLSFNGTTLETTNLASSTTNLTAGTGLTGGGTISADRTFNVDFAASGVSSATQAVRADDSRLSDARTPTAHTHSAGEVNGLATVATSGAYADLSGTPTVPSALGDLSNVSSTAPANGEVLKWNGTAWAPGTDLTGTGGTGAPTNAQYFTLTADASLTDERVLAFSTGLTGTDGGAGGNYTVVVDYGTTAGTACEGNDSRLSDARTPTAHTHAAGDITSGTLAYGLMPVGTTASTLCAGDDARLSDDRNPTAHTHDMVDSYVGHIEAPAAGTYHIDTYAATARTVIGIHIVVGNDTVDYSVNRVSGGFTAQIYTADGQGTTQANVTSGLTNTSLSAGDQLTLVIDAVSGTPADLRFTVVYSRTTGAIT